MAEGDKTQLDKLTLDIQVKDNDSASKINSVASAIRNLTKSLAGLQDANKQMNQLQNLFKNLNQNLKGSSKNVKNHLAGKINSVIPFVYLAL